ncbi:hypothetical protein [Psychroserpens luteus]|uniref:Uncharacterized protein n=1 Tax=Psychroserpens luteus TaxID=1434066 RepID=A0ABW5ZV17_9FLAO|nr:hypothetical protein [Psychroserpens luteus]
MNSLKEFFLSFFESAKDRLKNPVIGAFVIAWLAVNWRFLAILLFSSKTIEQKIEFVETNYFDIDFNLWIPLTFSVFYVLILPYIMALFDWLSQKGIASRKLISKNHRITDIQNRQEIAAEEWQLEKIKEGSPDIQAMKLKISQLEEQLLEKDDVITNLSENLTPDDVESVEVKNLSENKKSQTKRKTSTKPKKTRPEKDTKEKTKNINLELKDFPVMKDIVIRDLAKTEREWILIFALYSSDYGKKVFTRENIITKYDESNRKTNSRLANVSNNLKNMVKAGQVKFVNDDDMLLTEIGKEIAIEILNR